jgi:succinate dehydrogenase / fumarate reductase membrane anchor subunit
MVRHGYEKNPVGAHYGVGNWLVQRFSAVVMALYTILAAPYLLWRAPASHAQWKALFAGGFFRLATLLAIVALLWHAWIGMRDIFIDYLHGFALRLGAQAVVAVVLVFYLIWSVSILWGR